MILKIDTPLCSARRLEEVCNDLKEFLNHDLSADYYNEHLNYIGDGSINEVLLQSLRFLSLFIFITKLLQHYDTASVFDHKPSTSGVSRSQSVHQYTMQNNQNERSDIKKMFEELESKLSQHSLNLLNDTKENNDTVVITRKE